MSFLQKRLFSPFWPLWLRKDRVKSICEGRERSIALRRVRSQPIQRAHDKCDFKSPSEFTGENLEVMLGTHYVQMARTVPGINLQTSSARRRSCELSRVEESTRHATIG